MTDSSFLETALLQKLRGGPIRLNDALQVVAGSCQPDAAAVERLRRVIAVFANNGLLVVTARRGQDQQTVTTQQAADHLSRPESWTRAQQAEVVLWLDLTEKGRALTDSCRSTHDDESLSDTSR